MATNTGGKGRSSSGDPRRGGRPVAKGAAGPGPKGAAKRSGAKPPAAREEPDTAAQLAEPLRRVLARLPATQRRVLELRMGLADGHPHDAPDAARMMGISLGELREIEARAFERIREVIPLQQLQRFLDR